jgi:hypothetical protein
MLHRNTAEMTALTIIASFCAAVPNYAKHPYENCCIRD